MAASLALLVFRLSAERPKLGDADAAIASPARDPFIVGMTGSVLIFPPPRFLPPQVLTGNTPRKGYESRRGIGAVMRIREELLGQSVAWCRGRAERGRDGADYG
jgi:hypothetical protein